MDTFIFLAVFYIFIVTCFMFGAPVTEQALYLLCTLLSSSCQVWYSTISRPGDYNI